MNKTQWLLAAAAALSFVTGHWWLGGLATALCVADGFVESED
jgi:hypothetical protein